MMKYFVMAHDYRPSQYMSGKWNPIYTQVFPNRDFAGSGYWLWLKSSRGNGFDVKVFDGNYIYMRSTELVWTNNTTFKRFVHDLPIAARYVTEGEASAEIKVADTSFEYYSSCKSYKRSRLGTAVSKLESPRLIDTGGNIGKVWSRVLDYYYNCNAKFERCTDEELFYLANGYGLWQWKHFKNGALVKTTLINNIEPGSADISLPCSASYEP